jgi:hypothetical protein
MIWQEMYAEWVLDVYRPIIDNESNDFNYFRGNYIRIKWRRWKRSGSARDHEEEGYFEQW